MIEIGNQIRTTHSTTSNDTSSRSHCVCQILIKDVKDNFVGKLSLVDLAGSERAQNCQSNNRQRRLEGADINKSLLALKECIRALDTKSSHVPFRASKLTMILRDSFIASEDKSRIIMISCVSPGHTSADHTINTLRYSERLKEKSGNRGIENGENQSIIEVDEDCMNINGNAHHNIPKSTRESVANKVSECNTNSQKELKNQPIKKWNKKTEKQNLDPKPLNNINKINTIDSQKNEVQSLII